MLLALGYTVLQWETVSEIFHLFEKYPLSFLAIPIIWIFLLVILKYGVGVYVSPWWALIAFIASVGVAIGIVLYAKDQGWISVIMLNLHNLLFLP
jgi:hypothetical protein